MTRTKIEFVDFGAQGEYGFFGKVVATSDVTGKTVAESDAEIAEMRALLGGHIVAREVEQVPAL